eukprot:11782687-Heterocapsa_arctica.AAC.1
MPLQSWLLDAKECTLTLHLLHLAHPTANLLQLLVLRVHLAQDRGLRHDGVELGVVTYDLRCPSSAS